MQNQYLWSTCPTIAAFKRSKQRAIWPLEYPLKDSVFFTDRINGLVYGMITFGIAAIFMAVLLFKKLPSSHTDKTEAL